MYSSVSIHARAETPELDSLPPGVTGQLVRLVSGEEQITLSVDDDTGVGALSDAIDLLNTTGLKTTIQFKDRPLRDAVFNELLELRSLHGAEMDPSLLTPEQFLRLAPRLRLLTLHAQKCDIDHLLSVPELANLEILEIAQVRRMNPQVDRNSHQTARRDLPLNGVLSDSSKAVTSLPQLKGLSLHGTLTPWLDAVTNSKSIEALSIIDSDIEQWMIRRIVDQTKVNRLGLYHCNVKSGAFEPMKNSKNIKCLHFHFNTINTNDLQYIIECESVDDFHLSAPTDPASDLETIAKAKYLKKLTVSLFEFKDQHITALKSMNGLKYLKCSTLIEAGTLRTSSSLSAIQFRTLQSSMPDTTIDYDLPEARLVKPADKAIQ
jgi:hypothetical protein